MNVYIYKINKTTQNSDVGQFSARVELFWKRFRNDKAKM